MKNEITHSEKQLLELVAAGNELAFTKLFHHHRNRIYTIAIQLTKSDTIAQDIVQEVFLKVWLKRESLIEIQNFSAYIFIVTRNHTYRILKNMASNYITKFPPGEEALINDDDPANGVMEKELNFILQEAINELPNKQKQVYYLVKDQGLKRNDVADQLHIRPETVKFHLSQAMKNIRAFCTLRLSLIIGFSALLCFF